MNENSLQQQVNATQQTFVLAKGIARMKSINPIFLTKEVNDFVYDLISDYSYRKYSDLSFSDKTQLAGILMKISADGECIVESKNYTKLMGKISKCLIAGTPQAKISLYDNVAETAIDYYNDTMREIFFNVYDNCIAEGDIC